MTLNFASITTFLCLACLLVIPGTTLASDIPQFVSHPKRTSGGLHLPLYKRTSSLSRRGETTASIGLGDDSDISYNVMIQVGDVSMPVVVDTGSSDLWVVSNDCQQPMCNNGLPLYPQTTFQSDNLDIQLFYGDSLTGTHAFGEAGKDSIVLAGINVQNQSFAAINDTNSTVLTTGSTGLFGFGFPLNSVIWNELFKQQFPNDMQPPLEKRSPPRYSPLASLSHLFSRPSRSKMQTRSRVAPDNTRTRFPDLHSLLPQQTSSKDKRQQPISSPSLADILGSFATNGPLISRLSQNDFSLPQFTLTLQRDTVDVGGNVGMLSLGELPPGVNNDSLTWVPVRRYTAEQGGLPAQDDVYPIAWEIPVDNVFIDGQQLPQSTLSPGISVTALIDSGNSLIRGPADVVQSLDTILSNSRRGGGTFDCSVPHTMAFQIGGQMFPVDPRDFALPSERGSLRECAPNVVETDPPRDGFLYSWSLGDPFLKSNLVSFYFGNLTHPSVDPPRIGFMSTVPSDASKEYQNVIASAKQNGEIFPATSQEPPLPTSPAFTTVVASGPEVTSIADLGSENSLSSASDSSDSSSSNSSSSSSGGSEGPIGAATMNTSSAIHGVQLSTINLFISFLFGSYIFLKN